MCVTCAVVIFYDWDTVFLGVLGEPFSLCVCFLGVASSPPLSPAASNLCLCVRCWEEKKHCYLFMATCVCMGTCEWVRVYVY